MTFSPNFGNTPPDPGAMLAPMAPQPELLPPEAEFGAPEEQPQPKPVDYRVRLTKDRREELGRWLRDEIDRYLEATQWRRDNLLTWRDDYEMMPADGKQRWSGSSQVRAPFTRYACKQYATRLNQQIVEADPPVVAKAREANAMAAVPSIEEAMAAKLEEAEWPIAARKVHGELPITGDTFLRVQYERKFKRVPKLDIDFDKDTFDILRLAGAPIHVAQMEAVKRDANGAIKFSLGYENVLTYAGPTFRSIPWEDGIICPVTAADATEARIMGECLRISGYELERGVKGGLFIEEEVERLLKRSSDDVTEDKQERYDHAGVEIPSGDSAMARHDARYRYYDCYRLSFLFDANDDGEQEMCIGTLHYETGRLLGVHVSPYEHGEHIYHFFGLEPRAGQLFSTGVAELITTLQDMGTALLNQLIDYGDLAIHLGATFIHDTLAGLDPDEFELKLGQLIPVRDIRGIKQLELPPRAGDILAELQLLKDWVDLLVGTSNPSLGKETDTQRTAREVMVVASNANLNFEENAAALSQHWMRVFDQVRWITAQFGDNVTVKYRRSPRAAAMGEDPFGEIDADTLLSAVDLVPAGLQQLSDMQSRVSQALAVNNELRTNPLTMNNLEVHLIGLESYLTAIKEPMKEQILAAVKKQLAADQAVAAAELAAAGQMGMLPPGAEGAVPPEAAAAPPQEMPPAGPGQMPPAEGGMPQ